MTNLMRYTKGSLGSSRMKLLLILLLLFGCNETLAPQDCAGVENGTAYLDDCGLCTEGDTGLVANYLKDCTGECGGDAMVDCAGECNGDAVDLGCGCDDPAALEGYACAGNWLAIAENIIPNSCIFFVYKHIIIFCI